MAKKSGLGKGLDALIPAAPKKAVEKLNLVAAGSVRTIREGQAQMIATAELVRDDIVEFKAGDQICADGILRTGQLQVNEALITGESLGQVASQTLQAIGTTDAVVSLPVFRPLIGMDKEEIIQIARRIDTFETSILPFEDCCTVFTPKHPKTRPELAKVEAEEAKLDVKALEDEAFLTMTTRTFALY